MMPVILVTGGEPKQNKPKDRSMATRARTTIRAGLVGAGYAARFHYEALTRVQAAHVEIQGVFDLNPAASDAFARQHGIAAYPSLEALLDAVDVVHVCTVVAGHEPVTILALERGLHAIVEKPLTGYMGDGSPAFNGDTFPKETALREGMSSVRRMLDAERASRGRICYAENWIYAPAIQREREIIEKTGAQILWMHGEQAHSGSTSPAYAEWCKSGGGVLISKGCHPLSTALYLKRVEGRARDGRPIRPAAVSARTQAITRLPGFRDEGHLRRDYHDIDDWSMMHVVFEDGTLATIMASDILMGGVKNRIEVAANNHRTICNMNPNTAMQVYNEREESFADIYTVEKIGVKTGWTNMTPDEGWFHGYQQEIEAFYRTAALGEPLESGSDLAADSIAVIYAAYMSAEQKGAEVAVPCMSKQQETP